MDRSKSRRRTVYEGKAKVLFEGPEPGTLIQYFKDDATAFNNQKQGVITGKGVLNNRISEYLMLRLGAIGIPTHFVRRLNMREQLIKQVEIIPLEVVVRNVVAGSLAQRLGIEEGTSLPRSIVEYYYKSDELGDPMVTEEHITAFGWASYQEIDEILNLSLRINDYLTGLFAGVGLRLIDFKLEYGRLWEDEDLHVVLADEISPDSCRLWDTRDQREAGQGPLPPRPGPGRGGLSGGRAAARHPARSGPARSQGAGDRPVSTDVRRRAMKARIHVRLKDGVLDPQGAAIGRALVQLGFDGVGDVRQGKLIELDLAETDRASAERRLQAMCEQLLANPVIETYAVSLEN